MASKRHSAEQIVRKLREAEVELAKGARVKDARAGSWDHRAHLVPVATGVRRAESGEEVRPEVVDLEEHEKAA